jgi:Leucine-rich repeat (LRR) protein
VSTCIKFIITCFLLLTLSACGGSGGETSPQKTISLELPADQTITEYDSITLTALLTDNGANIRSFNWKQKTGIALNLPVARDGESHAQITITAPNVQKDELITLEFKVVHGDTETIKQITITVKVANDDITDMVFTDNNFAACVREQAERQGLKLARELTALYCFNQDISSAADLKHFINLTSLIISNDEITTTNQKLKAIDISKLTKLETLDLSYNELTDINLRKQKHLKYLALANNSITEIDLSEQTQLTQLDLSQNEQIDIDLNAQTQLAELYLWGNELTEIDLGAQTQLTILWIPSNKLTEIDLSAQTQLAELYLWGNELTEIDLGAQTQLTYLLLYSNQLTNIDLSAQTQLIKLYLDSNQLTDIDLSAQTQLTELYLDSNQLTDIDLSAQTQLTDLK